jgi:hypothetical protein
MSGAGRIVFLALASAALHLTPVQAQAPDPKPLLGVFVGRAEDQLRERGPLEQRDIDMVIEPYQEDGLRVQWTNVTLVDGRRDVPGVKRRSDEMLLAPAPGRSFFLGGVGYDPFKTKKEVDPLAGDPLRWGMVEGEALATYSFMILEDGTYELQVARRQPLPDGIGLEFDRIVDGEVVRRMIGRAARSD